MDNVLQFPDAPRTEASVQRLAGAALACWADRCRQALASELAWAFPKGIPSGLEQMWFGYAYPRYSYHMEGGIINWKSLLEAFIHVEVRTHHLYGPVGEVIVEEARGSDPLGDWHGRNE